MEQLAIYKPSAFYFRRALRQARTKDEAVAVGMHLCAELEELKQWVRDRGLVPPKWHLMQSEIREKNW